jgi:predicted ribonuclease YlaK
MTTAKEYHEVFIPLPDVYELGGSEIFKHLERKQEGERNLVGIPFNFLEDLERKVHDNSFGGSMDVLKFLKNSSAAQIPSDKEKIDLRRIYAGLDIAIVDHEFKYDRDFLEKYAEDVRKYYSLSDSPPVFITNNEINHIRLSSHRGIRVEEPDYLQVSEDIVNEGIILGNEELQSKLYEENGTIPLEEAAEILGRELYINQFIKFIDSTNNQNRYARVTGKINRNKSQDIIGVSSPVLKLLENKEYKRRLTIGKYTIDNVLGVEPLDMEQYIALQYGLLNPDVPLFFLCGSQGSGKTLLSYAAAVDLVLWYDKETRSLRGLDPETKGGHFDHIILLKPNEILGGKRRDPGALPGDLYQKIKPHLEPFIDAHGETILKGILPFDQMIKHPKFANDYGEPRSKDINEKKINGCAYLPADTEVVRVTFSGFMRGRSFRDTLLLIDEAQNFTPYEIKTLIERMGPGSKYIIMGDPDQFDNPLCSKGINGLTSAIKHYLQRDYTGLVKLTRNYRHQASRDALSWKVYSA